MKINQIFLIYVIYIKVKCLHECMQNRLILDTSQTKKTDVYTIGFAVFSALILISRYIKVIESLRSEKKTINFEKKKQKSLEKPSIIEKDF